MNKQEFFEKLSEMSSGMWQADTPNGGKLTMRMRKDGKGIFVPPYLTQGEGSDAGGD